VTVRAPLSLLLPAVLVPLLAACGGPGSDPAGPAPSPSASTAPAADAAATPGPAESAGGPLAWLVEADTSQEDGMSVMLCSWDSSLDSLADDYINDIQLAGQGDSSLELNFEAKNGNPPLFYYFSNTDGVSQDVVELRGELTVERSADGAIAGGSGTGRTRTTTTDGDVRTTDDAWVTVSVSRVPDSGYCLPIPDWATDEG
jgi:hypothetical protein